MIKRLLLVLLVLIGFTFNSSASEYVARSLCLKKEVLKDATDPLNGINLMLRDEKNGLGPLITNKALTIIKCVQRYNIEHNNILTLIDYSRPSNEKRLWVFDLHQKKLLFHTFVSHGVKSGVRFSDTFSNIYNSKASSIGLYKTEQSYYGREGLSLRLEGIDPGFNDNAMNRALVMHGGWYVNENFIQKYGRAGRSWGCPALPLDLSQTIINTIKNHSLLIVYYPSELWFLKSKFLNCDRSLIEQSTSHPFSRQTTTLMNGNELGEGILFVDLNKNKSRQENEPVVTISTENYRRIFHTQPPVTRMLRRQVNADEYIVLSPTEFKTLAANNPQDLETIFFIKPVVTMRRGYYATEMHLVNLGKINSSQPIVDNPEPAGTMTINLNARSPIVFRTTNVFIRWLGL